MGVVALIGITVTIILTRTSDGNDSANVAACFVNKGDIEIQAELWINNKDFWPTGNLSDIEADLDYFP